MRKGYNWEIHERGTKRKRRAGGIKGRVRAGGRNGAREDGVK